ncbi:hypothetical protein [Marinomonas aquiplantarum]|nr:hypothetical protein [Marinomonas aquiplantarum]
MITWSVTLALSAGCLWLIAGAFALLTANYIWVKALLAVVAKDLFARGLA